MVACALPAACGSDRSGSRPATGLLPSEFTSWTPDRDAFEPAHLRIHPLTRVTRSADGSAVLMCHLELRDSFGQVVKTLGMVQVELFVADAQGKIKDPGAPPERVWPVDLRDPESNAAAYDDVVTRTYMLRLTALPPALADLADTGTTPGAKERASFALRARWLYKDAKGDGRQIETEAPIASP